MNFFSSVTRFSQSERALTAQGDGCVFYFSCFRSFSPCEAVNLAARSLQSRRAARSGFYVLCFPHFLLSRAVPNGSCFNLGSFS